MRDAAGSAKERHGIVGKVTRTRDITRKAGRVYFPQSDADMPVDNDSGDGPAGEHQKELTVSVAASSMINPSDVITEEAYQANLKRIQEVKEMALRLEMNNEAAHKNFLLDQLEKRAKDGREAE